jgi:hypothetical protein
MGPQKSNGYGTVSEWSRNGFERFKLTFEPLEMPVHSKFTHSIQWYAQYYGISLGLAKKLSAAGVNFDDPEVMRAHTQATSRGSEDEKNSPFNPLVSTEALETQAGMNPGIQRLQADEVRLYVIYQKAQASGNIAKAKACREA